MKIAFERGPWIVGCIDSEALLERCARQLPEDCDVLEVRLDRTGLCGGQWMEYCETIQAAGRPVLLTLRSKSQGGDWEGREAERAALYLSGLRSVSAVDVEIGSRALESLIGDIQRQGVDVVASYHDFTGTPELERLLALEARGRKIGANVVKIATRVESPADLARLFAVPARAGGPVCVMGMGARGAISRIALPCAGSCLVYGYLETAGVPGQLSCRELAAELRRWGARKA